MKTKPKPEPKPALTFRCSIPAEDFWEAVGIGTACAAGIICTWIAVSLWPELLLR